MIDRIKSEYWYWQWEITHRGLPQPECWCTRGLCPWCNWQVSVGSAGWYECLNCHNDFYCADTKGTYMESPGEWSRWMCFHPEHSPILPKGSEFEAPPLTRFTMKAWVLATAPSAHSDLCKYWKHGHIILWKRLRMHARRWGLLKD